MRPGVTQDHGESHSLDPNCGWTRGKADVVYVANAFDVIARTRDRLEKGSA
jgi:hypothetical protein